MTSKLNGKLNGAAAGLAKSQSTANTRARPQTSKPTEPLRSKSKIATNPASPNKAEIRVSRPGTTAGQNETGSGGKQTKTRGVSASPNRAFKAEFGAGAKTQLKNEQAAEDFVDPIYDEKCPISSSIKERKDAGAINTMVSKPGLKAPFTFEFTLNGPGAQIEETKKEAKKKAAAAEAAEKGTTEKAVKCPITASILERKNAGSVVTIVNKPPEQAEEGFTFKLVKGGGPKLEETPTRKSKAK